MLERLEKLEKELMGVYAEIKKEMPNLHHLSFEATTYEGLIGTRFGGYYHIGKECAIWKTVAELAAVVAEARERRAKDEILYQQFGGIL